MSATRHIATGVQPALLAAASDALQFADGRASIRIPLLAAFASGFDVDDVIEFAIYLGMDMDEDVPLLWIADEGLVSSSSGTAPP